MRPQTTYRSLRGLASLSRSRVTTTTTTTESIASSVTSSLVTPRPTTSSLASFARFFSSTTTTATSSSSHLVIKSSRYNSPALSSSQRPLSSSHKHMSFFKRLFFSSPPSPEAMAKATEKAQKLIDENKAVVFSKSYCPHCRSTKGTLNSLGADYKLIELDQESDGAELQDALEQISGQRTVPNVYIAQKHIGGNSDLQALNSKDELATLLKDAGAIA